MNFWDVLDKALPAISALIGAATAVVAAWLANWGQSRNTERSEQRDLALKLLLWIERYCDTIGRRRKVWSIEVPGDNTDPLNSLRERIAAYAQGLTSKVARDHLEKIDLILWRVRDPWLPGKSEPYFLNPYPVKQAARLLLGAIRRGDKVPTELPMLKDLYEDAKGIQDWFEEQGEAQRASDAEDEKAS